MAKLASGEDPETAWRGAGFVDGLSHARRLTMPTLLTAGGADETCRAEGIEMLFHRLPSTRGYCLLDGHPHSYSQPFGALALAWFRLYA